MGSAAGGFIAMTSLPVVREKVLLRKVEKPIHFHVQTYISSDAATYLSYRQQISR